MKREREYQKISRSRGGWSKSADSMRSDLFCSWAAGRLKYSRPTNHNRDTGIFAQKGEGNARSHGKPNPN
ncbi:hypothetical protein FOXYSP1_00687 [Fusarium oxysporum f. sp. phaseoli]